MDQNESHFDEVTPKSTVTEVKTEIALYDNRPVDKVSFHFVIEAGASYLYNDDY